MLRFELFVGLDSGVYFLCGKPFWGKNYQKAKKKRGKRGGKRKGESDKEDCKKNEKRVIDSIPKICNFKLAKFIKKKHGLDVPKVLNKVSPSQQALHRNFHSLFFFIYDFNFRRCLKCLNAAKIGVDYRVLPHSLSCWLSVSGKTTTGLSMSSSTFRQNGCKAAFKSIIAVQYAKRCFIRSIIIFNLNLNYFK